MPVFSTELRSYHLEALERMKMSLSTYWVIEKWIAGEKVEVKETKKLRTMGYIKDEKLSDAATNMYEQLLAMVEPVQKKRGVREKPTGQYADQWNEFWLQWPDMRSIPNGGKALECKKEFKGGEQQCRIKYNKAIIEGKITPEMLNYAAKVYIATGIYESLRKNKNDLEYMSGMLPWLNQGKYMLWVNVQMPEEVVKPKEMISI